MAFTEQKAARILELRRYSENRSRCSGATACVGRDGMSAWIEGMATRPRGIWDETVLAAQVHATNEINGVLVEARLKSNRCDCRAAGGSEQHTGLRSRRRTATHRPQQELAALEPQLFVAARPKLVEYRAPVGAGHRRARRARSVVFEDTAGRRNGRAGPAIATVVHAR
jgi:hypothetical protein